MTSDVTSKRTSENSMCNTSIHSINITFYTLDNDHDRTPLEINQPICFEAQK